MLRRAGRSTVPWPPQLQGESQAGRAQEGSLGPRSHSQPCSKSREGARAKPGTWLLVDGGPCGEKSSSVTHTEHCHVPSSDSCTETCPICAGGKQSTQAGAQPVHNSPVSCLSANPNCHPHHVYETNGNSKRDNAVMRAVPRFWGHGLQAE